MDEMKLRKTLENLNVPEADENARKRALNLAVAEFKSNQQKTEKTSQGSRVLSRLMGTSNPNTRRDPMETKSKHRIMYGGMATAMAVILITGVTVSQFQNSKVIKDYDARDLQATADGGSASSAESEVDNLAALSTPIEAPGSRLVMDEKKEIGEKSKISGDRTRQDLSAVGNMVAASPPVMASAVQESIAPYFPPPGVIAVDDTSQNYYHDVGRDKFEDFEINPFKAVNAEPVSTFSTDVDTASYSFIRAQINGGVLPQKDAVRVEEMVNYFDYNYPLPETREQPFKPTVTITPSPWNEGKKLMHIGIRGFDVQDENPRSNLVFLLDTSGSMNEPNKLPLVVNSLKMLLESLRPDDTVAIAVYAGSAGTVLEPTKISDKAKIIAALDNLSAGGSTAGAEGINLAYQLAEQNFDKGAVNRVILATDGDFNVGITNPEELQDFVERKRDAGIFLSVLGFGQGNYNDQTMQTLAQNGNGVAAYIDTLNEARKVLVDEATSTLFPIAKDVKIQVEFNPKTVAEYRLVGYETRHLNRVDFNNDAVDAGDIGAGHTVTAIYEITPVGGPVTVDALRYGETKPAETDKVKADTNFSEELAFVKIRYKLPNEDVSKLITTPVMDFKVGANQDWTDVNFATAVAGFGQLLQGGKYTGSLTYDDVIAMAQSAKGDDPFGQRAEFINLVRLAKSSAAMQPR